MANWPTSLPLPLVDGAGYTPQPNTIRTPMAAGVPKMRRRFTAVGDDFVAKLWLTGDEFDVLEAFAVTTLKDVLPFTWEPTRRPDGMPLGRACRFKARPSRIPLGMDWWEVQLDLEVLP